MALFKTGLFRAGLFSTGFYGGTGAAKAAPVPAGRASSYLDQSSDYLLWVNTQPVTVEYARRAAADPADPARGGAADANQADFIPVAKRRPVRSRERSPSNGVYAGYEARWLIPGALLPPGVRLKPGDVVIEADGTRHTVLTADLNRNGATQLLGTVNLVLAFDLRTTIGVERAALSYDAAGAPVKLWPSGPPPNGGRLLYAAVPAAVQLLTREYKLERGIEGFQGDYAVTVGRQLAVDKQDRVVLADGSYLDVNAVRNPSRIDELQVLDCQKRV